MAKAVDRRRKHVRFSGGPPLQAFFVSWSPAFLVHRKSVVGSIPVHRDPSSAPRSGRAPGALEWNASPPRETRSRLDRGPPIAWRVQLWPQCLGQWEMCSPEADPVSAKRDASLSLVAFVADSWAQLGHRYFVLAAHNAP